MATLHTCDTCGRFTEVVFAFRVSYNPRRDARAKRSEATASEQHTFKREYCQDCARKQLQAFREGDSLEKLR